MQIGVVGMPFSGKSTLFTTLLSRKTSSADYKTKHIAERGVINVQDERLDQLPALFKPWSKVNATVEYVKTPGKQPAPFTLILNMVLSVRMLSPVRI